MVYKNRIILSFLPILLIFHVGIGMCLEKETLPLLPDRVFNHAPNLLELPDGTILAAWNSGSKEKSRDNAIVLSFKKPGSKEWSPTPALPASASTSRRRDGKPSASPRGERGESTGCRTGWSYPEILVDTPNRADGNPVLFLLGNEIYCFYSSLWGTGWSTAQLFCTKSELNLSVEGTGDINFSWTSPKRIFPFYRMGDLGRSKPIILNDKEFILPLYREFSGYYSYVCKFKDGKMVYQSPFLKSIPGNLQPAIILTSNGSLLMLMRPEKGGYFWQSFSQDTGETWNRVVRREDLFNPDSGFDVVRLVSGKIILAFNDSSKTRYNLTLALSEDEGKNFPIRKILEEAEGVDFAYPSIIQDSKGKIHIIYSVNKEEIRYVVLDEGEISDTYSQ